MNASGFCSNHLVYILKAMSNKYNPSSSGHWPVIIEVLSEIHYHVCPVDQSIIIDYPVNNIPCCQRPEHELREAKTRVLNSC